MPVINQFKRSISGFFLFWGSFGWDMTVTRGMTSCGLRESPPPPKQPTWPPKSTRTRRHSHSETAPAHARVCTHRNACGRPRVDWVFFVKPLHSPLSSHLTAPLALALHPCMTWPTICSELQRERPLSMWRSLPTETYCRLLIHHWLLRQIVINEAHRR